MPHLPSGKPKKEVSQWPSWLESNHVPNIKIPYLLSRRKVASWNGQIDPFALSYLGSGPIKVVRNRHKTIGICISMQIDVTESSRFSDLKSMLLIEWLNVSGSSSSSSHQPDGSPGSSRQRSTGKVDWLIFPPFPPSLPLSLILIPLTIPWYTHCLNMQFKDSFCYSLCYSLTH